MRGRLLSVPLALAVTGCIGAADMFAPEKSLVGPYTLFQTESGFFKLGGPGKPAEDAGGYIDGTVDSLGWSRSRLLVWRGRPTYGGDRAGWMVIDVMSGSVAGPLSTAARLQDATLAAIPVRSASIVWKE
jgi:hypothetical protein